jgi:hypothetical protein
VEKNGRRESEAVVVMVGGLCVRVSVCVWFALGCGKNAWSRWSAERGKGEECVCNRDSVDKQ